jgi:hypothetical protein
MRNLPPASSTVPANVLPGMEAFADEVLRLEAAARVGGKVTGYAASPGSGPAGETCKTCKHLCRSTYNRTYLKCGVIRHRWTRGPGTDIRAKSPACRIWEGKT